MPAMMVGLSTSRLRRLVADSNVESPEQRLRQMSHPLCDDGAHVQAKVA